MPNSIIIKRLGAEVIEEYTATAVAIKPGFLLELASATTVQAHSAAAGNVAPAMFAIEDQFQGKAITTDSAVSAKIQCWIPRKGDIVYAYLADGENASVGSLLESNGAGALQVFVADEPSDQQYPENIVGVALEAVDLTGSANLTALGRIRVRIT
jgi:hypothetical protein